MKKDVTGYMYGGDITRKMKLREKQKRGKDRMEREGKVHISHDTFLRRNNFNFSVITFLIYELSLPEVRKKYYK